MDSTKTPHSGKPELIVYQGHSKETELNMKLDQKIIIARVTGKKKIFVRGIRIISAVSSYTCKVFVPKLGFISYKVEKRNGKIIKSATYVKPSEKDLADSKEHCLPVDFMSYLNHYADSECSDYREPFYFYVDHVEGQDSTKKYYLIVIISYIYKRDPDFISYVLPYVMRTSKDYYVCLGYVNKIREFYPFEKYSKKYIRSVGEETELQNDYRKECDVSYDEVYYNNVCRLEEGFRKEEDKLFELEKKTSPKEGDMFANRYAQMSVISSIIDEDEEYYDQCLCVEKGIEELEKEERIEEELSKLKEIE